MMKLLKQLLFTLLVVGGLSLSASAQRNDDNRRVPDKEKPPVIKPGDKEKPKEKPRDDNNSNRPKKPDNYEADV